MATKKDLQEAVGFSRRRLLTAFTSGAPGGKELEPAKPLRAAIAGIAIAAAVIVAGLFYGFLRPGLPEGWQDHSLIVLKDTGGRFVAVDGTLYPVINTASARLLISASEFRMVVTDQATISGIPVGPTIGIVGAPDDLPAVASLRGEGWTACAVAGGETSVGIARTALAEPAAGAAVVERDGREYVLLGGERLAVAGDAPDAVLRAVGLDAAAATEVDGRWLNLFDAGADLEPLVVDGAGEEVPGTALRIGQVVHPDGAPDEERYLVTADAELAPIGPLAYQLYLLGTGGELGAATPISPAQLSSLRTAAQPAGAGWPEALLTPAGGGPCALLQHDDQGNPSTVLASPVASPAVPLDQPGVRLEASTGALVRGGGSGGDALGVVSVIDSTGTAYAVPEADTEVLARLGYAPENVSRVTDRWLQFFPTGPELSVAAAGSTPNTGTLVVTPPKEETAADADLAFDADEECTAGVITLVPDTPRPLTQLQTSLTSRISTGKGVLVAVVDSGIDASNPQLSAAVVGGIDLVGDGTDPRGFTDIDGHGTVVAGIIAAQHAEGSGVIGVAPDARLLSVRVFRADDDRTKEAGFGPNLDRLVAGIRWATDAGADVINLSLSDPDGSPALAAAVKDAVDRGVVVVASGGNRGTAIDKTDGLRYPAAYPGVLAVAAANAAGRVTDTSIHGAHIDVSAPGSFVLSTQTTAGNCLVNQDEPSSSFATGYASGAAALLVAAFPDESPELIDYRLEASAARGDPDARDDFAGWGFIQPYEALTLVPDAELRGPAFAGAPAPALRPEGVTVAADAAPPAIRQTRELAIGAVSVVAVIVGALVVITLVRRRPAPPAAAAGGGGLFPTKTPDPE